VEILDGVKVGETIATSGLSQLATGTAVTIQTGSGNGSAPGQSERGGPGKGKDRTEGVVGNLAAGVRSPGIAA